MRLTPSLVACVLLAASTACGSLTDPLSPTGSPTLARRPVAMATAHTPILFVHGWNSSSSTWTTMIGRFKTDGWTNAELANFSYNTSQSNATTAAIIQGKVDSIIAATGSPRVTIISHSMGALSSRYYARHLGGDGKIDALISLGGPNHGTSTANVCVQTSCIEMRANSTFLNDLNSIDETWGTPRYATWWSPCDEVINPQTSTILSGATNTQTACMTHSALHENATVYSQVKSWVTAAPTATLLASSSLTFR